MPGLLLTRWTAPTAPASATYEPSLAVVAQGRKQADLGGKGRPVDLRDTMIAGIVVTRHATLATRNVVHFEDLSVPVVNPWLV